MSSSWCNPSVVGSVVAWDTWYFGVCMSIRKGVLWAYKPNLYVQGVEFRFKLPCIDIVCKYSWHSTQTISLVSVKAVICLGFFWTCCPNTFLHTCVSFVRDLCYSIYGQVSVYPQVTQGTLTYGNYSINLFTCLESEQAECYSLLHKFGGLFYSCTKV